MSETSLLVTQTLSLILAISGILATYLLVKSGYLYLTSSGNPITLERAKGTIVKTVIGIVIIIAASTITHILTSYWGTQPTLPSHSTFSAPQAVSVTSGSPFSQIVTEAVSGFMQSIVSSALKPLVSNLFQFLTSTPLMSQNAALFGIWLGVVGVANALLVLVVALVGFDILTTSALGFEELQLGQLAPKLLLTFIGANGSIFLIDWCITFTNSLSSIFLHLNNSSSETWAMRLLDPTSFLSSGVNLFTLLLFVLLVLLVTTLLLLYFARLITLSLGVAVAPLVFLLWFHPRTEKIAVQLATSYALTLGMVVVHVLILEVASTLLSDTSSSSLLNPLIGIALLLTLLKSGSFLGKIALYALGVGSLGQLAQYARAALFTKEVRRVV